MKKKKESFNVDIARIHNEFLLCDNGALGAIVRIIYMCLLLEDYKMRDYEIKRACNIFNGDDERGKKTFQEVFEYFVESEDDSTFYLPIAKELVEAKKSKSEKMRQNIKKRWEGKQTASDEQTPKRKYSSEQNAAVKEFVNLYNAICTNLPQCTKVSKQRRQKILARLKENNDLNYWKEIFNAIQNNKFYCGMNDRNWKADIDWIIENDNRHVRIYEKLVVNNKQTQNRSYGWES